MPATRSTSRVTPATNASPTRGVRRKAVPARRPEVITLSESDDGSLQACSPRRQRQPKKKKQSVEKSRVKPVSKKPANVVITEIVEISSGDEVPCDKARLNWDLGKQVKDLKAQVTHLQFECSELKASATVVEDHITCEICALKLWSPYILPGCGHTFCQTCIGDWFNTILQQHIKTHPNYSLNHHAYNQYTDPPFTCPMCRKAVKTMPVENFALKAVVRAVAEANGEQPPGGTTIGAQGPRPWDLYF